MPDTTIAMTNAGCLALSGAGAAVVDTASFIVTVVTSNMLDAGCRAVAYARSIMVDAGRFDVFLVAISMTDAAGFIVFDNTDVVPGVRGDMPSSGNSVPAAGRTCMCDTTQVATCGVGVVITFIRVRPAVMRPVMTHTTVVASPGYRMRER